MVYRFFKNKIEHGDSSEAYYVNEGYVKVMQKTAYELLVILTSPLVRAKETARHISEMTGIPMEIEPRLMEQNFGKYESTPRDGAEFHEAQKDMASRFGTGESMLRDIA